MLGCDRLLVQARSLFDGFSFDAFPPLPVSHHARRYRAMWGQARSVLTQEGRATADCSQRGKVTNPQSPRPAGGVFIGGLCVTLNLSERRVSSSPLNTLVEMDLRPTNPNCLTDEELMAIAAGADRTNQAV
jgi:hypothetical protein